MKNGTDPKKQVPNLIQLALFIGFVISVITEMVSEIATHYFYLLGEDNAKALLSNKANLKKRIRESGIRAELEIIFPSTIDPHREIRAYWENFYLVHFKIKVDFRGVLTPEMPKEGKWRLIFITKGLTLSVGLGILKGEFVGYDSKYNVWKYTDDVESITDKNIRTSTESYAVWVHDDVESDAEFKGKSTSVADPDFAKAIGCTVLEHCVHCIAHFVETKKHLAFTLCSGSRTADGIVPFMWWGEDGQLVYVNCCGMNFSHGGGGVRRVVAA